ncbi:MAG: nucleoside deaminase [Alphaproteobacteria bacterium TMED89]|nr:tRNA-specific adenosine deaminase [Rhodospirillaceae bacterium]RPH16848.1 MAG: nucleoside deaminase [Alphaproteobacteria bacterium TMED89]
MTLAFMNDALRAATSAEAAGEVPVGAVVVHAGKIIATAANRVERDQDPSAHAEILAIRAAAGVLGSKWLTDCDLYVTLEPCPMCAGAISLARLRRLYYGAADPKSGGVDHGPRVFSQPTCHHAPEVIAGVEESRCGEVLKRFFAERR